VVEGEHKFLGRYQPGNAEEIDFAAEEFELGE